MNTTLYYLSATGNSLHIAKTLKETMKNTTLHSIPEMLSSAHLTASSEAVGFVFPLHYFGLPLLVETFIEKIDLTNTTYIFAIASCGSPAFSDAFHQIRKLLQAKNKVLAASFHVKMISIYLPLSNLPSTDKVTRHLLAADKHIKEISAALMRGTTTNATEYMYLPSRLMHNHWTSRKSVIDQNFSCDMNCRACGLCEKICPTQNIQLQDGRPVWQHHCTECLACLHVCPEKAINLGRHTKGRTRYHHPDIKISELLRKEK